MQKSNETALQTECVQLYHSSVSFIVVTWRVRFVDSLNTIFVEYPLVDSLVVLPSVLWRCWLGGRKGIRPVKNFEWCSTGMVVCLERDADLHVAPLMPLPLTVSCFSKIQIAFTFLVPAHPGSPGKRAVKRVCVWFTAREMSHQFIWLLLLLLLNEEIKVA